MSGEETIVQSEGMMSCHAAQLEREKRGEDRRTAAAQWQFSQEEMPREKDALQQGQQQGENGDARTSATEAKAEEKKQYADLKIKCALFVTLLCFVWIVLLKTGEGEGENLNSSERRGANELLLPSRFIEGDEERAIETKEEAVLSVGGERHPEKSLGQGTDELARQAARSFLLGKCDKSMRFYQQLQREEPEELKWIQLSRLVERSCGKGRGSL